ncbi:MAG: tRNA (5-methylaminomethyl-2-thiouridine)(34)-methyltransferase MnmD [Bacteroidales bacterium]|nr:tRNA (5-methylaminomethyl-2-thiouridine)(34)-methyltransferase MnmD [Bacteroidales bacterium]MCF8404600.1 tRNA (5-methylaminomethyl-2-thiouridine)(34)-methyltransferase MnmD [Bacteroidales bacterium]
MGIELIKTEDGSFTLYNNELGEVYHSRFGAVSESLHIYISAGLNNLQGILKEIHLLEIGFGTGLNAYLTSLQAAKNKVKILYHTLEPYPLSEEIISKLNYPQVYGNEPETFNKIHQAIWGNPAFINPHFNLLKIKETLELASLPSNFYHLVYFDAFAPDLQSVLWEKPMFVKLNQSMKTGGILVTYSTKGIVKRNLAGAGFRIEKIPGPKGKREIIRATKE